MAITAPPSIVALPLAPDPNDRATFNARAYPWAAAQATLAADLGAVAENVYNNATEAASLAATASAQVELAAASANYKGPWAALVGALNMPASVAHAGNYWALNADLADVTTATPGISAAWQPLNIGAGGAAEVSSAVDIALTAASFRVQAIAMTASGKSVSVPDATTLSAGAELFVIKNTGSIEYAVRNAAGTMLAKLAPGRVMALHLSNASSSAGAWAVTGDGIADTIYQAVATTVTSSAASQLSVTALSATQSLVTWYNASGFLSACTLNISGIVVTAGAVLTTGATLTTTRTKVVAMSATQALVVYSAITTTYLTAMTLNVAGTTVTAGAALTVSTLATAWSDLTMLSSTQAIVVYPGTSGYGEARTLNISGTTVTAGAACVVSAQASTPGCVAAVSGTQAVAGYVASAVILYTYLLTVSGTTITAGASPAVIASGSNYLAATAVSSTQVVAVATGSTSTPRFVLFELSGSTVVVKDMVEFYGAENNLVSSLVKISEGRFMVLHGYAGGSSGTGKVGMQFLRVHDSQINIASTYETVKNSSMDTGKNAAICTLNANKLLAAYVEPTGYLQTKVLEVGA